MLRNKLFVVALIVGSLVTSASGQQWRPVSGSRQANISGMALIEHDRQQSVFLIVHDNKKKDQDHIAIITVNGAEAPKYAPLQWTSDDVPVDLESVTAIPGVADQFIVLTAAGRAYHVKIDRVAATVALIKAFNVPMIPNDADFEGFSLQKVDGTLVVAWAERGLTAKPATLFWGKFDLATDTISDVRSATFRVLYPTLDVRHISDVKIDTSGGVFVTSASDPGNDGPFSSAMYYAGVLRPTPDKSFSFIQPSALTRLYLFNYHKVEGFELVPGADGGIVFGTDDENLGAAILLTY